MDIFEYFGQLFFKNQTQWFNTSSLTHEQCNALLRKPYNVENNNFTLEFEYIGNVETYKNANVVRCTFEKIVFYRSSAIVHVSDIHFETAHHVCSIDPSENEAVQLFDDTIELQHEHVEPVHNIENEINHDLLKKKQQIKNLKEESRQFLQNYYLSKTKLLETQKEMDVLKSHFSR